MDHIDLVDTLVPTPTHTLVVETPTGDLVLVDTSRPPGPGDTVFAEGSFTAWRAGMFVSGVAYCVIKFL